MDRAAEVGANSPSANARTPTAGPAAAKSATGGDHNKTASNGGGNNDDGGEGDGGDDNSGGGGGSSSSTIIIVVVVVLLVFVAIGVASAFVYRRQQANGSVTSNRINPKWGPLQVSSASRHTC